MNGSLAPHFEILPPAQLRLWPELKQTSGLGFVLYGGTAVALRLGHRASIDFDFFTDEPLDRDAIQAAFPFMASATVVQDQPNALSVLVPGGSPESEYVKVSFFGTIRFGRIAEPDLTEDGVLQVAALDDLMATKVKVVLQRVEAKDYRDVAALIQAGTSLRRGLAGAREMFGPSFQPSESMKALVYFEGGDLATLSGEEKQVLVRAVSEVRDLPSVSILSRRLVVAKASPDNLHESAP